MSANVSGDPLLMKPIVGASCALAATGHTTANTAQQRDELPAPHSITSSARARHIGGTSMPSAFAALRLMTSSNLVGSRKGKSAGFAPLSTFAV